MPLKFLNFFNRNGYHHYYSFAYIRISVRNIANQLTIQAKYIFYNTGIVSNFLPKLFSRNFYRSFDRNSDLDLDRRNWTSEKQLFFCVLNVTTTVPVLYTVQ
jgi:hypothetical protein